MTPIELLKKELSLRKFIANQRGFSSKTKEAKELIPQYEKAIETLELNYRIYDSEEKNYFNIDGKPTRFNSIKEAWQFVDMYLHEGNYNPINVIYIHEFKGDDFTYEFKINQ